MNSQKKLKLNLRTFKSILRECYARGVSAYFDNETGEVFSAKDMLPEEIQNRKRYFKIPSKKIWSISKAQARSWIENTFQAFSQIYDRTFLEEFKLRLEQTLKNDNFPTLILDIIMELDRVVLDDNFFESWLDFVNKQEKHNIEVWLASKGIELDESFREF